MVVDAAVAVDAAVNVPKVLQELLVQRKNSTG
jgi:hypothetical protein